LGGELLGTGSTRAPEDGAMAPALRANLIQACVEKMHAWTFQTPQDADAPGCMWRNRRSLQGHPTRANSVDRAEGTSSCAAPSGCLSMAGSTSVVPDTWMDDGVRVFHKFGFMCVQGSHVCSILGGCSVRHESILMPSDWCSPSIRSTLRACAKTDAMECNLILWAALMAMSTAPLLLVVTPTSCPILITSNARIVWGLCWLVVATTLAMLSAAPLFLFGGPACLPIGVTQSTIERIDRTLRWRRRGWWRRAAATSLDRAALAMNSAAPLLLGHAPTCLPVGEAISAVVWVDGSCWGDWHDWRRRHEHSGWWCGRLWAGQMVNSAAPILLVLLPLRRRVNSAIERIPAWRGWG